MTGVSVLVLTKNEQQDLPGCLQSVSWSDDIHVYDSFSTDETVAIAMRFGATVTQRPFDNWAKHQNWGLMNIQFKHEWVYYADADERVTPELAEAIHQAILAKPDFVAFRVQRRDYLMDTWLQHVTPSPFNIRLFRPASIRYERLTNPVTIVDGCIGEIREHFNHYPFSKGMTHWFDKHNNYSSFEAGQIVSCKKSAVKLNFRKLIFGSNRNERRFHQKELYYRLPFRPVLMFVLLYIFKRGFLDGKAGLTFAFLRSIYEYMIVLKVREMEAAEPTIEEESLRPAAFR